MGKLQPGVNDLETWCKKNGREELLQEWDYDKNEGLTPKDISYGSRTKHWWKCKDCNNLFLQTPNSRTTGHGCPNCACTRQKKAEIKTRIHNGKSLYDFCINNNLRYILNEYSDTKNKYSTKEITYGSRQKVWWHCQRCGQDYMATPNSKTQGMKCPVCAGKIVIKGYNDFASQCPELLNEWDYNKNTSILPENITIGSNRQVWWVCKKGHSWKTSPNSRVKNGSGCKICAGNRVSFPEKAIYYYIKQLFPLAKENYQPIWLHPKEIDIYVPELNTAIEYDGIAFHKNKISKDSEKSLKCIQNKVRLIRVREYGLPPDKLSENILISKSPVTDDILSETICILLKLLYVDKIDVNVSHDAAKIIDMIDKNIKEQSLHAYIDKHPEYHYLINEWDVVKNGNLTTYDITPFSNHKVSWICTTCNTQWIATPGSRIHGCGCPECAKRKQIETRVHNYAIKNSAILKAPALIKDWHPYLNGDKGLVDYSASSKQKVWWKCSVCGYEWQATIQNRVNGYGCPKCKIKRMQKQVLNIDTNQKFDSIKSAAKNINLSEQYLGKCIKKGKICGGYHWKFYEEKGEENDGKE